MFTLQAPYPALQTTTVLPNPQFGDTEGVGAAVAVKHAMDGTVYTYVKRKGRRKYQWTFKTTRNKGLELRAFLLAYGASKVKATDHNERVFVGYFLNNPFELESGGRAAPKIAPMPRGEYQITTIEFEGEEQ